LYQRKGKGLLWHTIMTCLCRVREGVTIEVDRPSDSAPFHPYHGISEEGEIFFFFPEYLKRRGKQVRSQTTELGCPGLCNPDIRKNGLTTRVHYDIEYHQGGWEVAL
jgi:hypothetical protein